MTSSKLTGLALVVVSAVSGCHGDSSAKKKKGGHNHDGHDHGVHLPIPEDPWASAGRTDCERLGFPPSIDVPEASAAVWLSGAESGGADVVLVVADSGHDGKYVEVDAKDGHVVRHGKLPLGSGASDDLEGLATDGVRLWGITSAGWVRAWVRNGDRFRLVLGPYPIEAHHTCKRDGVNCGHDFEGLCLRPAGKPDAQGCVGFAAARAEGALFCVRTEDDRLMLGAPGDGEQPKPGPVISANRALADCAIGGDGAVWTGDNRFGGATVRRLDAPVWEAPLGDGFPEAMALAPGGVIYRFSDSGYAPSLADRYRCPAAKSGPAAATISEPPAPPSTDDE